MSECSEHGRSCSGNHFNQEIADIVGLLIECNNILSKNVQPDPAIMVDRRYIYVGPKHQMAIRKAVEILRDVGNLPS